jgi:flagellar hook-basal body complex protein FliE
MRKLTGALSDLRNAQKKIAEAKTALDATNEGSIDEIFHQVDDSALNLLVLIEILNLLDVKANLLPSIPAVDKPDEIVGFGQF